MRVLDRTEVRPVAVDAARADHRDLAVEIDERLEDRLLASERRPRPRAHRPACAIAHLPLAVVAERRGLQHRRTADRAATAAADRPRCAPARTARRAARASARNVFSRRRCCAIAQRAAVRPDDRVLLGGRRRGRRHVLELERHDVDACAQTRARHRGRRTRRRPRRRRSARSACRARARACARGSPAGARPSRTCGRAGRRRARRSSSRAG